MCRLRAPNNNPSGISFYIISFFHIFPPSVSKLFHSPENWHFKIWFQRVSNFIHTTCNPIKPGVYCPLTDDIVAHVEFNVIDSLRHVDTEPCVSRLYMLSWFSLSMPPSNLILLHFWCYSTNTVPMLLVSLFHFYAKHSTELAFASRTHVCLTDCRFLTQGDWCYFQALYSHDSEKIGSRILSAFVW